MWPSDTKSMQHCVSALNKWGSPPFGDFSPTVFAFFWMASDTFQYNRKVGLLTFRNTILWRWTPSQVIEHALLANYNRACGCLHPCLPLSVGDGGRVTQGLRGGHMSDECAISIISNIKHAMTIIKTFHLLSIIHHFEGSEGVVNMEISLRC